jgi:hypothetical protein
MIAALGTLVFLATLWMLVVVGAAVLNASGSRILAALKGQSAVPTVTTRPVRIRHQRYQPLRPAPVSVRQRAAA